MQLILLFSQDSPFPLLQKRVGKSIKLGRWVAHEEEEFLRLDVVLMLSLNHRLVIRLICKAPALQGETEEARLYLFYLRES